MNYKIRTKKHLASIISIGMLIINTYPVSATYFSRDNTPLTANESKEIDDYLSNYNSSKKITKSFLDSTGATINCVDVSSDSNIQLQPSSALAAILPGAIKHDDSPSACPKGSVESRLPSRKDIVDSGSLRKFFSKYPSDTTQNIIRSKSNIAPQYAGGHEYAHAYKWANVIGIQSTVNIWQPAVQSSSEFSLTQLWAVGGSGASTQTVEVGSQVYPQRHSGDTRPYLFIYYTADNYATTGCYDLGCGFVKTSNVLNVGGPLPSSTVGGSQVEGTIAFYRDPSTQNWILFSVDSAGNYTQSGYYPASLFGTGQLSNYATRIDFGGEIYANSNTQHTTTDMGSGQASNTGYQQAAYQRNLKYADLNGTIQNVGGLTFSTTNSNCYSTTSGTNTSWGTSFYFGGRGYSASCL